MSTERAQQQWVQWIWAQAGAEPPDGLRAVGPLPVVQGLSAYREHAKALTVRAMAAAYPMLQQWLGNADFAGMAWAYARWQPPQQGDMNRFGDNLAEFLEELPGMEPEPPALARLEWHLHQLAWAADDAPADPELWSQLQTQDPSGLCLSLSPNVAVFALPETLLAHVRPSAVAELAQAPTHAVAWRRGWRPVWALTDVGLATLLLQWHEGATLGRSIELALAQMPSLDLAQAFQWAAQEGWLLACTVCESP